MMGNAHVLWVYEDAVRDAPPGKSKDLKRKQEIGEAVVELCQPRMSRADPELRSVAVDSHSNAVNLAGQGEVHSSWQQVYLWSRNCLRPVYELDDDDLRAARQLIDEKLEERATHRA